MRFFAGLRPITARGALRETLAGVNLAAINIPQVLGYARIAGMPVVTGLYTVLLPLLAFAAFGSSRHLVSPRIRQRPPFSQAPYRIWRLQAVRPMWVSSVRSRY